MLDKFKAYQMAKKFHFLCRSLRVSQFAADQLLRASASVVLNLAESSGKQTSRDRRRYYGIAFGSLRECQAILELERISDPEITRLADELAAILFTMTRGRKGPENCSPTTATDTATETH